MNQNQNLLLDIQNFKSTKENISIIYYNRNKHLLEYEENADLYWLVSDILLYMKKTNNPFYKKCNKTYNKSFTLNINLTIHNLLNTFWSKLHPDQRNKFIEIRK